MKRCTFHVPVEQVLVVSIIGLDEEDARAKLERDEDVQHIYSFPGTTKSGGIELVTCTEIAQGGRNRGEK